MPKRSFRRKFQTGGIIPNASNAAQLFNRPVQIPAAPNPIIFDANTAVSAINVRNQNIRLGLDQQRQNLNERRFAWEQERINRDYIEARANQFVTNMEAGLEELTQLDLNSDNQSRLAVRMRRSLNDLNQRSAQIMVDSSLSPEERSQRLRELSVGTQKLFSDPEYIKYIQRNQIAKQTYTNIAENVTNGQNLIDFQAAQNNLDLTRQYQNGDITTSAYVSKIRNYTLEPNYILNREKELDKMVLNSLDPDKAVTNFEIYSDSEDFLITKEVMEVGSLEDQVDYYYNTIVDENFKKAAEGGHKYIDETGSYSEEKYREHLRRKLQLLRSQLGQKSEEGGRFVVDIESRAKRNPNTTTYQAAQSERIRRELENDGYTINDESILDQLKSKSEAVALLTTPDQELSEADLFFKKQVRAAITPPQKIFGPQQPAEFRNTTENVTEPAPANNITEPAPATDATGNVTKPAPATSTERLQETPPDPQFANQGFILNNDLQPGDNNAVVPEFLDKNLGFYTNNPFNIKVPDSQPVIKRFDRGLENPEQDTVFHAVYPSMQEGYSAGVETIRRYQSGENATFKANLEKEGKTIDDATVEDLYRTYSEKAGRDKEYAKKVAKQMTDLIGVEPDTKIKDIPVERLAMAIMSIENPDIFKAITNVTPVDLPISNVGVTTTDLTNLPPNPPAISKPVTPVTNITQQANDLLRQNMLKRQGN